MLHHHFPGLCDADMPDSDRPYRIFKALDADDDGFLNYAEFCCGMSVLLRGTPHERLRLIFKVMNRLGATLGAGAAAACLLPLGCGVPWKAACSTPVSDRYVRILMRVGLDPRHRAQARTSP